MLSPPTRASRQAPGSSIARKRREQRWFIKRSFLVFLPNALLSGLGIGGRERLEVSTAETLLAEREAVHVDVTTAALDETLATLHHDVMFLRDLAGLQQFLQQPLPRARQRMVADFLNMATHRNTKQSVNGKGTMKTITVRVKRVDGQRGRIKVEDDEVGIAVEDLPRVFEYGFTTKQGGRGVGLLHGAIAAKSMDGSLGRTSEGPGKGVTLCSICR